jgi:hypothetical protein
LHPGIGTFATNKLPGGKRSYQFLIFFGALVNMNRKFVRKSVSQATFFSSTPIFQVKPACPKDLASKKI